MLLAVLLTSCGEYQQLLKSRDPEVKYQAALRYFNDKQYVKAQTLLDDARRVEHLVYAKGREREALDYYRREAAKMWIVKEVLLAEALARGYEASPADESFFEQAAFAAARLLEARGDAGAALAMLGHVADAEGKGAERALQEMARIRVGGRL